MTDINVLYEYLDHKGIELPLNTQLNSAGFIRWGKNNCYWAFDLIHDNGYVIGDFKDGSKDTVFANEDGELTPHEREERQQRIADAYQKLCETIEAQHNKARLTAEKIWNESSDASTDHQYLKTKRIKSYGLKQYGEALVIPLKDATDQLWSLEFIAPNGNKNLLANGKTNGCYYTIGQVSDNVIVCEGYATGASIYEATNMPVAVAFNKGNLRAVVAALKDKFTECNIIIAADNDVTNDGANVGVEEATKVANEFDCQIIIPTLTNGAKCDFNDVAAIEGLDKVKETFTQELTPNLPPKGYILTKEGLFHQASGNNLEKISERVEVLAECRNEKNDDWGRLIRFNDPDGNTKRIFVSNTLLSSGKTQRLAEELAFKGLKIFPRAQGELAKCLALWNTEKRARCVNEIGWHDGAFVFPTGSYKNSKGEEVCYQGEATNDFKQRGTLQDWKENISDKCIGNSRLILAVSLSFAGALLRFTNVESGGVHLVGTSSCGKTTVASVAASVWGSPDFIKTWNSTSNAITAVAAARNDSCIMLDEIGQADVETIGNTIYALSGGQDKLRSNISGALQHNRSWKTLFLSTGEVTLDELLKEVDKNAKAGQEVRCMSFNAIPNGSKYKVFEDIHEAVDGREFADSLKEACTQYYGVAAREFVNAIRNKVSKDILQDFKEYEQSFYVNNLPKDADTQVSRGARRFAIAGFAGEYATKMGITSWDEGMATDAAAKCFNDWCDMRGTIQNLEETTVFNNIQDYLLTNKDNFADIADATANQNGYVKSLDDGTKHYFVKTSIIKTVCENTNHNLAHDILLKALWITGRDVDKTTNIGNNIRGRYYEFTEKSLEA